MEESGLSNDLNRINNLVFQWKMNFNPDSSKQAQEVIFSSITKKSLRKPKLTLR